MYYVLGKIEMYPFRNLTLQFSVENSVHLKGIHTQLKWQGFVLGDKGKATNLLCLWTTTRYSLS